MKEWELYLVGYCIWMAQMIESTLSGVEVGPKAGVSVDDPKDEAFAREFGRSRAFGGIREILKRIKNDRIDDPLKARLEKIAEFRDQIAHRLMQTPEFIALMTQDACWDALPKMAKEMDEVFALVHSINLQARGNGPMASTSSMVELAKKIYPEIEKVRTGRKGSPTSGRSATPVNRPPSNQSHPPGVAHH